MNYVLIRHMAKKKCVPLNSTIVLLLISFIIISIFKQAIGSLDEVRWSRVNIPNEGNAGNWVLAEDSDIQHLVVASDGTIYCHANPAGTDYTLFKSADNGYSWSYIGRVKDDIVDIAIIPNETEHIYYATESNIYKSSDAGVSFTLLPYIPGLTDGNNVIISDIDVTRLDGNNIIIAGTRDTDKSQFGGIYLLDENEPLTGWIDTDIGNYDVHTVSFSPNYQSDLQIIAVVTDEKDTVVTTRIGDGNWGTVIGDAILSGIVPSSAVIAFPGNYNATDTDYTLFLAVNTGTDKGDVYKLYANQAPGKSAIIDLNAGSGYNLDDIDINGLALYGNTNTTFIIAGAASNTEVYISKDGGENWTKSKKSPTGQSRTYIRFVNDYDNSNIIYAATSGIDSALSCSTDGGVTWNQRGLIDTTISTIVDLAISPDYYHDNTHFILTFGNEHSLWRSLNRGSSWERILSSTQFDINEINLIKLTPLYSKNNHVVFLAGINNGKPAIWKSTDNGQTFKYNSTSFPVDTWEIVNNDNFFICGYNGNNGLCYNTTNGGLSYAEGVIVGNQPINSITVSPDYEWDKTILAGNTNGSVFWSNDNGKSFEPLPYEDDSQPLAGFISVAFDPDFSRNGIVYAISDTKVTATSTDRIFRFKIGKSDYWESIDTTIPIGSTLGKPVLSDDGTLYVSNSQQVDSLDKEGGIERSLNPTYSLGTKFETVTRGLEDNATLVGLWIQGNQLWSIDTTNKKLMTYIDSLSTAVTLKSPEDEASGIDINNTNLDWETLKGASGYEWQINYDTDFSSIPDRFQGNTKSSTVWLPELEMGKTYYWRVRATKPVLSRWSDKWSFTTILGNQIIAIQLLSPEAGASEVPVKPVFQWTAIADAECYELMVSTDSTFSDLVIDRNGTNVLPSTAWQSDINLEYNTTYYWKVRASSSTSYSAWSAVSAFTTNGSSQSVSPSENESPPGQVASSPQSESPPSTPPVPLFVQSSLPNWVIYTGGILLLVTIILLITVIILVVGIKRL